MGESGDIFVSGALLGGGEGSSFSWQTGGWCELLERVCTPYLHMEVGASMGVQYLSSCMICMLTMY